MVVWSLCRVNFFFAGRGAVFGLCFYGIYQQYLGYRVGGCISRRRVWRSCGWTFLVNQAGIVLDTGWWQRGGNLSISAW